MYAVSRAEQWTSPRQVYMDQGEMQMKFACISYLEFNVIQEVKVKVFQEYLQYYYLSY